MRGEERINQRRIDLARPGVKRLPGRSLGVGGDGGRGEKRGREAGELEFVFHVWAMVSSLLFRAWPDVHIGPLTIHR